MVSSLSDYFNILRKPHYVQIAKPPRKEPADKLILDRRVRDYQIIQAKEYLGGIKVL